MQRQQLLCPNHYHLVKIGLEEIEKLYYDPKWCQKLTLET